MEVSPEPGEQEQLLTQSAHIDVGSIAETEADAAAGGCRSSLTPESESIPLAGRSPGDLCLSIQPRDGRSSVASTSAAELERALRDTAGLQRHALAAIDRVSRQQAALRHFPMACPSCGTLNAPCSPSWGTGDVVACQGCSQSFVPLGMGLQDSDMHVLRSAIHRLRQDAERIQYLERIVTSRRGGRHASAPQQTPPSLPPVASSDVSHEGCLRQEPAGAPPLPELPPVPPQPLVPLPAPTASADGLPGKPPPRTLQPASSSRAGQEAAAALGSLRDRSSPARREGSSSNTQRRTRSPGLLPSPLPSSGPASQPWGIAAASSSAHTRSEAPGSEAKLMALMDTKDLMTSSSTNSVMETPRFYGLKLRQQQLDTERQALEALQHARENLATASGQALARAPAKQEREEGEITSASDSESSLRRGTWGPGPSLGMEARSPRHRSARLPPPSPPLGPVPPSSRTPTHSYGAASLQGSGSPCRGAAPTATGLREHCSEQWSTLRCVQQLVALFTTCLAMRSVLAKVAGSLGAGQAAMPALLAGALVASALTLGRAARHSLDLERMMDTNPAGWCHRAVSLRLGGPHWTLWTLELTLEEAFGLTCVLVLLALLLFLENWGLHGPRACRWLAVLGHAAVVVLLTFTTYEWLTRHLRVPERASDTAVSVVWLCIAIGNAASTSWAIATWWCTAAESSIASDGSSSGHLLARVPLLALASVHAANYWMACRARQPVLLAICVALAGISMGMGCYMVRRPEAPPMAFLAWTPTIYLAFCLGSAWVLWQELIQSL